MNPPDPPDPWAPSSAPWGARTRRAWLPLVVALALFAAAVVVAGLVRESDPGAGPATVGTPPPVAADGLEPTATVVVDGTPFAIGVGAFVPSPRSTPGTRLLVAPLVLRHDGAGTVPDPIAARRLLVALALPQVPAGPAAPDCRNAAPVSLLAPVAATFPGAEPGSCLLDARAAPVPGAAPAGPLGPGAQVAGVLVSSPIPDAVPDRVPEVWVATTTGPPAVYVRLG